MQNLGLEVDIYSFLMHCYQSEVCISLTVKMQRSMNIKRFNYLIDYIFTCRLFLKKYLKNFCQKMLILGPMEGYVVSPLLFL